MKEKIVCFRIELGKLLATLLIIFAISGYSITQAEVTDRGSYTTSITVDVPEFHEITPNIRLVYDSKSGNGPLGIGWSLDAGSHIARTSEFQGVPRYDLTDQLWLDGMELIPCPQPSLLTQTGLLSVSCKNGGTHTTRVENFMRVKHDASTNSWTVWQRDRTRLVYTPRLGDVSLLEKTFRWVLTEVVDTHSNRVIYNYICGASLTCYLSDIRYGEGKVCTPRPSPSPDSTPLPVGASIPGANIHFYWEKSRPDPVSIAIGGALEEIEWRLRAIDVTEERERVRIYQINYLPELSGVLGYKRHQSWITSIQEFGSDAQLDPNRNGTVISGTPLSPYTFEAPAQLYSPAPSFLNRLAGNNQFTPVAIAQPSLPSTYNATSVKRFAPSQTLIRTYHPGRHLAVQASTKLSVTLGDFDGDKKLDFMHWAMNSDCNELKTRTITARDGSSLPVVSSFQLPQANLCITTSLSADVDGDGRTDVLFLRYKRVDPHDPRNLKYETELISARSNGDGTFTFNNPVSLWTSDREELALLSQCGVGDLNGDGRSDLACTIFPKSVLRIGYAVSLGQGQFKIKEDYPIGQDGPTAQHTLSVADANGDGLSDLIVADQRPPSNAPKLDLKIGRSLGNGTFSWKSQQTSFNAGTQNQKTRILIGDFNGDGRADPIVVIVNDNDVNGSFTFFSSNGGENATFRVTQQEVKGVVPAPSVGDFNGDGLDDLAFAVREAGSTCKSTVTYDHQSFTYSLSRDGTLQIPNPFDTCYLPSTDWRWEGNWNYEAQATNVNGDLIADLFYYREWQDEFQLYDRPGQDSADNRRPWRSTDVSGDGLSDWVYVNYGNPGLVVQTQITQRDGTRRSVRQDVASSGGQNPDLTHAAALSDWFLIDVGGGPNESPDGKADVVIIDDVSQQIVTLLSNGDGTWRKIVTPTPMNWIHSLRGHPWRSPADISTWRAIDVNGDTATDLVHIAFDQPASGSAKLVVRTFDFYYETNNGSSKWIPVGTSELTFGGYLRHPTVRGLYPADINGDGRMDLVRIEHDPGLATSDNDNAIVWSLISRGNGSWDDRRDSVLLPNEASKRWFPMEVNGDGRTDFVYVMSEPGQPLLISSMISLGDGRWKDVEKTPVTFPPPIVNTEAVADFRIADVEGDGKQDFVHLSKIASNQIATMVIWNRYPHFIQTTTTGLQSGSNHTMAWRLVDMNADDRPELVRILPDLNPDLDMISIPVWETRMTRAQNGMGARDEIIYGTVVEQNRDMPLGMLSHVVKSVATYAVDSSGPPDLQINYTNSGATYSRQRRRFLGFKRVESNDSNRVISSDFDLTYECGARKLTEELLDDQRRLIGRTKSIFAPTGTVGTLAVGNIKAHSLCRVNTIQREEWERSNRPRLSEDRLKYDDYGNVIELLQTGDLANPGDDRKVESQFNYNVRDFLVNRIAEQTVSEIVGAGKWRQLARTRYEYDRSGNYQSAPGPIGDLTRARRWNDQTNDFVDTKYEYDKQGNVRVVTGPPIPSNPGGVSTSIEYDCEFNRFPEKICDSLFCTTISWDKRLGQMKSTIDANGARTEFSYDPLGRTILAEYPDKSFERWKWPTLNQWNTASQAVTHERSDGSRRGGVLWDVTYFDGLGRTTRLESKGGISQEILNYDGISDRVKEHTAPHFSQGQPAIMQSEYDAAGRLSFSRNPDSSTRRVQYDVGLYTTRNEVGATTGYEVDSFGRITAVRENRRDCFAETCPITETGITKYYYDALNQLTQIVDAKKNETKALWDSLGRQREACDPDRGCTFFKWNDDSTLESVTDANKSTLSVSYDQSGRPLLLNSTDKSGTNTRTIRWTWDRDPTGGLQGASLGRVTQVEDDSKVAKLISSYHYDDLGRVDRSNECIDGKCYELETMFDLAGRIKRVTYPDQSGRVTNSSLAVDYVYDNRGLLSSILGYVTTFTHDAAGETTGIVFANGIEETRPYDSQRGWSNGVQVRQGSRRRYFDQKVSHDYVRRVKEETITTRRGSHKDVFTHDDLGRLTVVSSNDPQRNRTFHYDLIGNMTYHSILGDLYYKDAAHVHAITGTSKGGSYKYDAVGQMLASAPNGLEVSWNDEHRPKEMENKATGEISRFAYGRDGIRVKSESNKGTSLFPHSLVEVDPSGNVVMWIMAEGRRLARRTRNGLSFLHTDSLGSTRLITNSSGVVIDENDYGAWGEETLITNTSGNTNRFAGSRSDEQTGLSYMNARYYDPASTRFISADPIIPDVYSPQTLNRYAYALNDPVSLTDPSGLCVVQTDQNGKGEVDCRTPEQAFREDQRAQQREEFRQARELGPVRLNLKQYPNPTTFEKDWADFKASDLGRSLYGVWTLFSTSQEIVLPFAVAAAALPAAASAAGVEAAGGIALEELAAIERASVLAAENSPRELAIRGLAAKGFSHTAGAIETIGTREGVTVFLERGTAQSGLGHLLSRPERLQQFANVGVAPGEIPQVVMKAVTQGKYLGSRGTDGLIFAVEHGGQTLRLEVVVADNGYIVTAIPKGLLRP